MEKSEGNSYLNQGPNGRWQGASVGSTASMKDIVHPTLIDEHWNCVVEGVKTVGIQLSIRRATTECLSKHKRCYTSRKIIFFEK